MDYVPPEHNWEKSLAKIERLETVNDFLLGALEFASVLDWNGSFAVFATTKARIKGAIQMAENNLEREDL